MYFAVLTALINISLRGSPVYGKVNRGIVSVVRLFSRSSSPASCSKQSYLQSGVRWLRVLLSEAQKIPEDGDFTTSFGRQFQCLTILIIEAAGRILQCILQILDPDCDLGVPFFTSG